MRMNRYRYDTGVVIDQSTGEILSTKQVVNRLNKYENTIKEAYNTERTQLGQSVLKQLLEAIQ